MAVVGTISGDPGPSSYAAAVTPSDTVNLEQPTRGLYVGVTGNVSVAMASGAGAAVVFIAVPAGAILPIQAKRVNATLTTATSIIALF